ncbi:tRNA 2-thiocytidine biosynthesis TtcA family protein [Ruminococcaceae bacterium OttesenSCG-928-A16]|nr:tRNA 2-thiocytidine biosynthesis TtcA family protein [Ruminococcaceae bacterium OttesenSCG-928-A16]
MQAPLQRLEGLLRKAMQMYTLIEPGDVVCVGVSGGKDSIALAVALANLSKYYEIPYTVKAVTLDPGFFGIETDYSEITTLLQAKGVPHIVQRTNIGQVVFDIRKEPNPCALCANLRRGALHTQAKLLGCNKVALGHHLDDVVETFYMNLFGEGRIGCFSPKTWLSRSELTLIRPLVLATEQEVIRAVRSQNLPVIKNPCPADGATERATTKEFVAQRSKADPAFRQKTLGAMQKAGIDGWAPQENGVHRKNNNKKLPTDTVL